MKLHKYLAVGIAIVGMLTVAAHADLNYTEGDGATRNKVLFDFICFTTKHCSAHTSINSTGTEIFTTTTPAQVGAPAAAFVDGSDATQGLTTDAGATAGGAGTVSAKLRAISRDIGTLTTMFNGNGRATSSNSSPVVPSAAPTTWHLISAASTNATPVKTAAATVFSCQLANVGSTVAYLKIYNKASAPTVGTDTPVKTLIIPKAGTAADGAGSNVTFGPGGFALGTGFAAAVTAGIADSDTAAVAASAIAINCDYE